RALPRPEEPPFEDVLTNAHRAEIEGLATAGIASGRGDRRYDPEAPVTRAELAAFLVRTYEHVTGSQVEAEQDAFRDDDGHVLEPEIDAAASLGLATGKTADTFAPGQRTRREEAATFVARLIGRLTADEVMSPRPVGYEARVGELPGSLRTAMNGVSWRDGCPVALDSLRLVELVHRDGDGGRAWGLLVVHRDVADDVADVFEELHAADFPVARMRLIDRYGGDDDRSMAANNTSAFNCRTVSGTARWSEHAYGRAIDVNPVQNPYVDGDRVEPEAGRAHLDRSDVRPGMVVRPGPVVEAFAAIGWGWGGDWSSAKDYQHVSQSGR
ncbi:MAG: M15 family metallopeptidase, partial [Nitriliruptorales bacterium]